MNTTKSMKTKRIDKSTFETELLLQDQATELSATGNPVIALPSYSEMTAL